MDLNLWIENSKARDGLVGGRTFVSTYSTVLHRFLCIHKCFQNSRKSRYIHQSSWMRSMGRSTCLQMAMNLCEHENQAVAKLSRSHRLLCARSAMPASQSTRVLRVLVLKVDIIVIRRAWEDGERLS